MEARWGPTAGGLIGRERELRELDARLRGRRLVTLVGPGGVGKTALGRVAAEQLEADETVVLSVVDLTKVSDPAAVAGAVAGQLGFDSFDAVLAAPVDTPCLLVIDNCEHVLDQAADVVAKLLGAARERTILATSRTPLDLPGESVFTVTPLDLPAPGDDPRASPAVMLFRQRCRDAGIVTVDGDIDAVAALCRHLDGLPLGIELAAARSRTMTVTEIAARLDDTVAVLDRPHFRGDARHRSVNTTIDWSCALLPPDAALLLERLSVFSGPFSAAAARAVAADATGDFDRQIDDLIHASLVAVDTAGTEATYRLLSTVRRYARQRLDDRGATGDVFDHFVDHVVSRAIDLVAELFQPWRAGLMHDLVEAYDDIAAALQWCISNDESPRRSYRLCLPLIGTVDQGRAEEITEMMRRLLARFPQQGLGGAQARAVLATGEYVTGAYQRGVDLATSTLEQHPGPDASTVGLYRVLGRARHALGDHEGSIAAFAHGARIGHALGLDDLAQELEAGAALSHADAGRTEVGLAAVTAIIEPARAAGSVTNVSWAATVRAWILLRVDPRAALDESTQALAHAKEIDFPLAVAIGHRTTAYAQLILGDLDAAAVMARAALDDLIARGALSNLRIAVDVAAALAHRAGHHHWQRLVATARALPITTPACARFEPVPLPVVTHLPLARHEVVGVVRETLDDVGAGEATDQGERAPTRGSMRTRGGQCEIEFDGRRITMRASKGLTYIAQLLARAGNDIHCTELARAGGYDATGDDVDVGAQLAADRVRDLQSDIDAADGDEDYRRSYQLQVELDAVIEQLAGSTATTPAGRPGDDTERARSAVTHGMRTAIRQLAKVHPTLGRHLDNAIRTGTYCSYRPERTVTWNVEELGRATARST